MTHCGDCRNLGNQSQHLFVERARSENIFRLWIESAKCGDSRNEHAHWVCVVMEAVNKALAHVFVNHRVMGDFVVPIF